MSKNPRHGETGPRGRSRRRHDGERSELLAEFELWLSSRDAAEPTRIMGSLLALKAEELDSPDPSLWTEELTVALLTEVVPRKVVQPRQAAMDMVPALSLFFEFLRDRGRWSEDSMPAQAAATLLAELEFTVLEAADDPTRRSFSTNILTYGLEHGVDLEDEDALAAYMEWYNALPHAQRVELSDRGRISDPDVTYDPSQAPPMPGGEHGTTFFARPAEHRDLPPAEDDRLAWPWFLPDTDLDLEGIGDWDPRRHLSTYQDNPLVRRALILLDLVGEGRRVTSTGALTRADTAAALARFGIDRSVRSMWEAPEVAPVWATLHDGDWLETVGNRVRLGSRPATPVPAEADTEQFIDFAHSLLLTALGTMWVRSGPDGGFLGMPDTLTTVLYICQEGGLRLYDPDVEDLPDIPLDPRTGEQDAQELRRYLRVTEDLSRLRRAGMLEGDQHHVRGSAPVLIAAIAMTEILGELGEDQ